MVKLYKELADVDLEEIDIIEEIDSFEEEEALSYPCCIISGISNEYEVELLTTYQCNPLASVPLYINYEGQIILLGKIELSSEYLLRLISFESVDKYTLELYEDYGKSKEIDFHNPDILRKFIRI